MESSQCWVWAMPVRSSKHRQWLNAAIDCKKKSVIPTSENQCNSRKEGYRLPVVHRQASTISCKPKTKTTQHARTRPVVQGNQAMFHVSPPPQNGLPESLCPQCDGHLDPPRRPFSLPSPVPFLPLIVSVDKPSAQPTEPRGLFP